MFPVRCWVASWSINLVEFCFRTVFWGKHVYYFSKLELLYRVELVRDKSQNKLRYLWLSGIFQLCFVILQGWLRRTTRGEGGQFVALFSLHGPEGNRRRDKALSCVNISRDERQAICRLLIMCPMFGYLWRYYSSLKWAGVRSLEKIMVCLQFFQNFLLQYFWSQIFYRCFVVNIILYSAHLVRG